MTGKTILVVDDTASILKLTRDIFELAGFTVITADDGELAITVLSEKKIDLVVTDILMPNMDGYILCYSIRTTEKIKDIPVIIYSATYTSLSDEEMAMEIGADKFIRKPASMDELIAAAEFLLSDAREYVHTVPAKPKALEASKLFNEGLVNKLERRNAELEGATKKLERNEFLLKEAQAITHIGNWEINLVNNTQSWSDEIYVLYGLQKGEVKASTEAFLSFMHPDDLAFASKNVEQAFVSLSNASIEYRFIRKDRAVRHGYSEWKFELDHAGKPVRLYGITQDITEKKEAEEKLTLSELRFRALIENSPEGISLTDEHSNVIYRSPGVQKITGTSIEGNKEKRIGLAHPDDLEMMKGKYDECYKMPGVPIPFLARFLHARGSYYWLEGTLTNLLRVKGVNAIVANFRDVSQRKQAEKSLIESNERFELVSKATSDAIWDWNIPEDVTTWNHGIRTLFGYEAETIDREGEWKQRIHPEDLGRILAELEDGFKNKEETWISSYRYKHIHGNYRHVFDRARVIYKNGKAVRMIGAMQDVDDQVKTLEEVKRLSIVASKTDNSVLIMDKDIGIEWINESFTRLTGYTLAEVIGKRPYELLRGPETDSIKEKEIIEKSKLQKPFTEEILNYAKDGRKYWARITVTPVVNSEGELDKFVTILQDITEQKTTEVTQREKLEKLVEVRTRELKEALNKEKELVEMKNKFVSIASHEFRTPLSTISFASESIRNYFHQLTAEEIQRKLIKIEDQASHMTNLLEDILTLGKTEAGKIKVKRISLDLKEFIESLIEEVRAMTKEKREINFQFSCSNNKVNADDKLLRNVVTNLLSNALKFSPAGTKVFINVSDRDENTMIEVTDEGIGIDERELNSVFESFQRGSNASAIQGTGLGLSILKKAVELMNGTIAVKSALNKGSTFTVQIPIG